MNAIQFTYNLFFNVTRANGDMNGIACAVYVMMFTIIACAIIEYKLDR